ncbi:MAG: SMI1/KNR4 family protein [Armatimonadota bacterium]
MQKITIDALDRHLERWPIARATEQPTIDEIAQAEAQLGVSFHPDYAEFLRRYGGAVVGGMEIYGLRPVEVMGEPWSVVESTLHARAEGWPGSEDWYVISNDGFGNPIGVARNGWVRLYDHDRGQHAVLAKSFEEFLWSWGKLPRRSSTDATP